MLEQFLQYLRFEKRYSEHTVVAYKNDLEQFIAYLNREFEINIDKSTHQQVRSWMADLMEEGISARTVNRKLSSLRTYYRYQLKSGNRSDNPISKVVAPKTSKKLPVFVDDRSMTALLDGFKFTDDFKGLRDRLILELFYQTGIRLTELVNIKDTDIKGDQVRVLGKRNKERLIPLHHNLLELIKEYCFTRDSEHPDNEGYLFLTDRGKKVYRKFVYRVVNNYLSEVSSMSKKSPHVLRHTFATHMLNNGADLNAIKEILGHANLSATQVYTHNSIEKLKRVHNQAHPRGEQ